MEGTEGCQQALGAAGCCEKLWRHHLATQVVGPAGVDATQQHIDQALEDGVASAGADHLAYGKIAVGQGGIR